MTKSSNAKLHIYNCSCGSFKRGSEYKKHLQTHKDHSLTWKRLVCTSCWMHAAFEDEDFLKQHNSCSVQRKTNCIQLVSWLRNIKRENPTIDIDSNSSEGDFSDEEDFKPEPLDKSRNNFIDKIVEKADNPAEELARAIENITSTPFQIDPPPPATTSQAAPPQIVPPPIAPPPTTPLPIAPPPTTPLLTAPPTTTPEAAPQPSPRTAPPPPPTTSQVTPTPTTPQVAPQPPPRAAPKKGIRQQAKKWSADIRKDEISQKRAQENILDRYNSLQARHTALLKDYEDLARSTRKAKDLQDENFELRGKLNSNNKSLAEAEKKLASTSSHLEFANTTCGLLSRKVAELEKQLDAVTKQAAITTATATATSNRIDLHIPIHLNVVTDDILVYPEGTKNVECYNDPELGVNCIHIKVATCGQNVTVTDQRVKKRAARLSNITLPDAQHQRQS
jgi:hypothetical protein